ncbi:MAG: hypothetical protein ABJE95_32945 [Byssovorax sp.]
MNAPADPLVPMEPAAAPEREPVPAAAEGYDPVELRRRMAVCFSGPELRELAESLGVTGQVSWDRGPSESSRDLIKQFEKYYGLGILVAKLRELRPLVEWPEPADPALALGALPAQIPVAAAPLSTPTFDRREAAESGAPLADPHAPSSSAAPRSTVAAAWPGTTGPTPAAPAAQKGIDPRVLVVVAGLTVLAALIAYAAGRASRPPDAAPDAAGSAAPAKPAKPAGPAMRAAGVFRRSLDRVVRSCDLPTGEERDASILGLALAHCGLTLRAPSSALTAPPLDPIIPNDRPPTTTKPKSTKTSKDPAQAAVAVTTKGDSCIAACETDRRSCNDHCGSEPTESSLYDGYMRCRSRCLSATSHCRLACPQ